MQGRGRIFSVNGDGGGSTTIISSLEKRANRGRGKTMISCVQDDYGSGLVMRVLIHGVLYWSGCMQDNYGIVLVMGVLIHWTYNFTLHQKYVFI